METIIKKPRNSSIEFLRILSIFGIILMHCCALVDAQHVSEANKHLTVLINAVCNTGVSCFVLISGYFGVLFVKGKFLRLALLTIFYTILASLLIYGFTVKVFFSFFSLLCFYPWFIACYLLLMIIAPYIEIVVTTIGKKQFQKLLISLFIIMSVLPTLTIGHANGCIVNSGGKCFTYFLFLYLVGRYIRLHHDKVYSSLRAGLVFLSMTLIIFALNTVCSYILEKEIVNFSLDTSPFILLSSISLFFFFKSHTFCSPIINYISKSVFAVYCLNGTYIYFNRKFISIADYSYDCSFFYLFMLVSTHHFLFWLSS